MFVDDVVFEVVVLVVLDFIGIILLINMMVLCFIILRRRGIDFRGGWVIYSMWCSMFLIFLVYLLWFYY